MNAAVFVVLCLLAIGLAIALDLLGVRAPEAM